MSSLSSIVSVSITKDSATVSRAGFGTPLLLTYNTVLAERAQVFGNDLTELTAAGFATSSPTYKMAQALFSQNPKVQQIVVGRRDNPFTQDMTITVDQVVNSYEYSVTINGTEFTFTSDATATNLEIAAGLVAAITAGAEPMTASDNLDGTFDLTADVAGALNEVDIDTNFLSRIDTTAAVASLSDDLAAVRAVNDDWYCLLLDSNSKAEIADIAADIETLSRILICSNADSDTLTSSSSDIASTLAAAEYDRTSYIYHPTPHEYTHCAWAGKLLPYDPGSVTWKFKTLAGIPTYALTASEQTYLEGKSGNHYQLVAGVSMTSEGTMASGEFIDVTRSLDFTEARIKESVFEKLAAALKIPYTSKGIRVIQSAVDSVLRLGVAQGIFTPDVQPIVTVPDIADISTVDKAARELRNISFTATLAGAVHKVYITGKVTV